MSNISHEINDYLKLSHVPEFWGRSFKQCGVNVGGIIFRHIGYGSITVSRVN